MARCTVHHVARRLAAALVRGRRWLALAALPACWASTVTASAAVVPADLVARAGDIPPGAAVALASTQPPFVLADGAVAFTGLLADGDAYVFLRDQVVWLGSNELASVLVGADSSMGATAAGGFVYGPQIDGADAVWTQNGLLALQGTQAPLYPMGVVTTFLSRPSMVGSGATYWLAGLNASGGTNTQQRVLYRSASASPADIEVVLASGDMVGGLVVSGSTGLDIDYHVSDDGLHLMMVVVMTTGSTANDEHVFVDGALFQQENTPNGTGDNWDNFDLVAINDQGTYVFTGDTNGDAASDEFVAVNGTIAVREGDVLDGVALTTTASLRMISIDNGDRIVHTWAYAGNTLETVFFACDATDLQGSSLAVLTADVDELDLDGDGLGDALVTDINATSATNTHALTEDGNIYLEVDLDDMGGAGPVPAMVRVPVSCCGNGMLDDGEECDDGDPDDTDACPGNCMIASCGDGYVLAGIEECDDADLTNTDACLVGCVAASCGDGFLWAGVEACDDADGDDTDDCPGSCMVASCGDGYVHAGTEECDDGNQDDTDACHSDCVVATCGDGQVWFGVEECDDANDDDTDGCPGSCMIASCGDGFVYADREECDDGNEDDTDGCTSDCTIAAATGDGSSSGGSTGSGTGDPAGSTGVGSSSGGIDLDDTASSGQTDTGVPMPATGTGEASSTGETDDGPFVGLDDDGGCSCVIGREHAGRGTLGSLLGLLVLGLRRRRSRASRGAAALRLPVREGQSRGPA
jgi:cysteine-rich repeat protein